MCLCMYIYTYVNININNNRNRNINNNIYELIYGVTSIALSFNSTKEKERKRSYRIESDRGSPYKKKRK